MAPISRRMFLVGSVVVAAGSVIAGCSSSDDTTAPETIAPDTTGPITAEPDAEAAITEPETTAPETTAPATTTTEPAPALPGDPFTLGVASGDPDPTSVILWTRLAPDPLQGGGMPDVDVSVTWELADDAEFTEVLASGTQTATTEHAHSVHVTATAPPGTAADTTLFYRFRVGEFTSPVGRTRIAPTGAVASASFVSASCQNYEDGFYTAHRDIAEQSLDFLVWLGDYIYEGAAKPVGTDGAVRSHGTPEPKDVAAYRNRYALYKTDPNLQAAHQSCPWFVIWDDHEVENNYADVTPQNPADTADFAARRQAAYQAWWEHQPVRLDPPAASGAYRIYRAVQWGDLIGMALLDTRQYRTDQACGDVTFNLDPPCAETGDEARTLTGTEQEQWLFDTIGRQGTTWNVIAQQVVMADISLNGAILNYDQWDGYPKDRERILAHLADSEVTNAIVLSGDIHLAGVAVLDTADGRAVAVEFVDTSISSGGLVPPETAALVKSFKEIVDVELAHRGYTLHSVTPSAWTATYRIVESALVPDSTVSTYATFVVDAGTPAVRVA